MQSKKSIISVLENLKLDINFKISTQEQSCDKLRNDEIKAIIGTNDDFNINIVNGRFDKDSSSLPKGVAVLKPVKVNNKELKACLTKSENIMVSVNHDFSKNGFTLKCDCTDNTRDIYINYINTFEDSFFNQMRNNYVFWARLPVKYY